MKTPVLLSLRSFQRQLRSGELTVLLLALALTVGAMSAVGLATDRVDQAVRRRAAASLAADLVVSADHPPPPEYLNAARELDLQTARTLSFPSVLTTEAATQLADIRAVSKAYPLRGQLRRANAPFEPGTRVDTLPRAGEVWLHSRLFAALDVAVGETVNVGEAELEVTGVLSYLPDQAMRFSEFAPTALMRLDDIEATGLLGPASRVSHRLLIAGPRTALRQLESRLATQLEAGEELRGVGEGRSRLGRALDRAEQFLGLSALVAVLVAAAAIALATRRYTARETDHVAVLKCLGASKRVIQGSHLFLLIWIGVAGSAAGVLLGYVGQAALIGLLGGLLDQQLPAPGWGPAATAATMGIVVLAGFGMPPVLRLGQTPPLRVLRREVQPPRLSSVTVFGEALGAVVVLLLWQTGDARLTAYVLAGAAGGFGLLAAGAWALVRALSSLRGQVGTAGRFGVANIVRRGPESIAQVVAFGIGVMALLLLSLVRNDLLDAWRATVPADAPNHFLFNIQSDAVDGVRAFLEERGLERSKFYPMVRARLTAINGRAADAQQFPDSGRGEWFTERSHNLTWTESVPAGNAIAAGEFWQTSPETPAISLEEDVANDLGLELGDRLTFDVLGESVTAPITNLREVQWESLRPNFFVIFSPGVLQDYPANWLTSVYIPPNEGKVILPLVKEYPSVTVLDVNAIIEQVRNIMTQASRAVQFVFIFTLAAGAVVMLAAVQATRESRRFESALLRTLGASRATVFAGVAAEFLLLGLLSGVLAVVAAATSAWLLATQVLELAWQVSPALWLGAITATTLLVALAGLAVTRRAVTHPPMGVLQRR